MMNLVSVDLNLLVALEALIAEGHVGRAARRIGRSQPAVSHALRRLRDLLGDPLLVRIGPRMELTPRAVALKESLPDALERVRSLLATESFDPATSVRRFLVVMHDHLADLIVPDVVRRMHRDAPGVRLDVLPWQSPFSMKPEQLRSIDFCISCSLDDLPGFDRSPLFTDTESVVVRRGHPAASRLKTLRGFLGASHVAVVGRGKAHDPVDAWLREEGAERRIALVVPSYLQALHAAATTDLVAFVPTRVAQTLGPRLSLTVLRPPIDPGTYQECLFFPQRRQRDAGSLWLRDIVMDLGRRIEVRGLSASHRAS
jgi:DNA-binding transcriptional LysR family regulator